MAHGPLVSSPNQLCSNVFSDLNWFLMDRNISVGINQIFPEGIWVFIFSSGNDICHEGYSIL